MHSSSACACSNQLPAQLSFHRSFSLLGWTPLPHLPMHLTCPPSLSLVARRFLSKHVCTQHAHARNTLTNNTAHTQHTRPTQCTHRPLQGKPRRWRARSRRLRSCACRSASYKASLPCETRRLQRKALAKEAQATKAAEAEVEQLRVQVGRGCTRRLSCTVHIA